MLDKIFISKVRIKILRLFLLSNDHKNHVRGVVRELNEEINAIRRELVNLEKAGILKAVKEGNKVVYSLNEQCPILSELKSMLRKSDPSVLAIHKAITKIENIKIAILSGHFFSQKYSSDKDVDLLIVGLPEVNTLNRHIEGLEQDLGRTIRVALFKPEEFDFRKKSKEDIVYNTIRTDKLILIGKDSDLL